MNKAVLYIVFNRLDYVQQTLPEIAKAKPPRFYIAADGAREHKKGEKELVDQVRKWILENINWECEIKTNFQPSNLGCGKGVSTAITWFFENEEEGIILEDDCVPNPSFFNYCEELLDYYKDDKRVWHIAGIQYVDNMPLNDSYYFCKFMHCWGWASWRDRWKKYDFTLSAYSEKDMENISSNVPLQDVWKKNLSIMKSDTPLDTWDYQWACIIIANKGLCINPYKNQITNIGVEGVHFNGATPEMFKATFSINSLIHPEQIVCDEFALAHYENSVTIPPDTATLNTESNLPTPEVNKISAIKKHVKKIRLFKKIILLRIQEVENTKKVYLFNFIPLLRKEKQNFITRYYLFFILRIIKKNDFLNIKTETFKNALAMTNKNSADKSLLQTSLTHKDKTPQTPQISPFLPLKTMSCNICNSPSQHVFNGIILQKYNVEYYFCYECGHLQTEKPYWIEEAYNQPINVADTGIIARNIHFQELTSNVLYTYFDKEAKYLEYASGYAILTRMMRDIGFDFLCYDKYTPNIFAKFFEFDMESGNKVELLTAIEVFEHFTEPMKEIAHLFEIADNILFSQTLLPYPVPQQDKWWYYSPEGGQHISFYSEQTLEYIAKKFNKNYVGYSDLHLFTSKKINSEELQELFLNSEANFAEIKRKMHSRTIDDMYYCIKKASDLNKII